MKNTIAKMEMSSKNQKFLSKWSGLFFIGILLLLSIPTNAQGNQKEVFTFNATALAFRNDSTMNATEDGWSGWQPFKAVIILNMEESFLKVVSEGAKRDYYIYEGDKTDEALIMKAVDYEGDDLSIKIQRSDDIIQIYFYYENFAHVYGVPVE